MAFSETFFIAGSCFLVLLCMFICDIVTKGGDINQKISKIEDSKDIFLSCFESQDQKIKAEIFFNECIESLNKGAFLMQRIDLLISVDDGPDCFFRRILEGE